jgi:hypothetical protein
MICSFDEIKNIILNNPNKELIDHGKQQAEILTRHVYGKGLKSSFKQMTYFENNEVFRNRTLNPTSNKDLFARLLAREEMVFTAHGGSSYYSDLNDKQTQELNAKLDSVRYGMNLRKWVKQFALQAYRCDPMGIILVEIDQNDNIYPTYKCISSIYDYQTTGRKLEYVCFQLTKADAIGFGIQDKDIDARKPGALTNYFRFIDDAFDVIYKKTATSIALIPIDGKDAIPNIFGKVPGCIISDIPAYDNPQKFISPLEFVIELADTYQNDRSIRDLQKKYTGFLKSIEPLLQCGTCQGTGFLSSSACPDCTPPGADRGTGYKLNTTVADVARFKMDKDVDPTKYFAYINVPTDVWNKQDTSLNDIENMINDVYWGTTLRSATTNGPEVGATNIEETATKTLANLQPIYARLNRTADWAQQTENIIVDFIGYHEFPEQFKKSSITYGRYYILETPDTLMDEYLDMKSKGANQTSLTEALKKYYHSAYKDNPVKLSIMVKLINVEPFVHNTVEEIKNIPTVNLSRIDYLSKIYYNDWLVAQNQDYLLVTSDIELKKSLNEFAVTKQEEISNELTDETTTLAEKIGVGATQSLQSILADPYMSNEQKKWALIYLFGLDEDKAINLTTNNKSDPKEPITEPIPKEMSIN